MTQTARTAAVLGAVSAVALAAMMAFAHLTPDGEHFRHTGDYLLTALGLPMVLAPLVLIVALHSLQAGRDGRLGRVGAIVACLSLAAFAPLFLYALIAGVASSLGPTYILLTLAAIVGVALFAAGAYRAGLLPRWLCPLWAIAWTLGGTLARQGMPLLLAAVYLIIASCLGNYPELQSAAWSSDLPPSPTSAT